MAELSRQDRELALARLAEIEQELSQASEWVDGDSDARERCAIMLEDAAKAVMAAAWTLTRDAYRVSELVHRRLPPAYPG